MDDPREFLIDITDMPGPWTDEELARLCVCGYRFGEHHAFPPHGRPLLGCPAFTAAAQPPKVGTL